MNAAIKAVAGLGLLGLGAPASYVAYSSWNSSNPTGKSWLEKNNYTFNPPQLASQETVSRNCSDVLFTKEITDKDKLYGCALMKIEKTNDDKFIRFNSEVSLRKGDKGWTINTRIDNSKYVQAMSGSNYATRVMFDYVFTSKTLNNGQEDRWFVMSIGGINTNEKVHIKSPKQGGEVWYDGEQLERKNTEQAGVEPNFTKSKEFLGVWISSEAGQEEWIFKNIEVWSSEKKYSEFFCKHEDRKHDDECESTNSSLGSKTAYKFSNLDDWSKVFDQGYNTASNEQIMESQIIPMITEIKGIRGEWKNMNNVCGIKDTRNLKEEELEQLRIYCSKPTPK